jgi:hypothetical protein
MRRSSETIGAIAAALAKAQGELSNPEKSLVGTIRSQNPYESDRTFRYAALSTGLDIVRKSLGGCEIAIVQTTAIDAEAGWIRLTTVLAHSSGEWLSSEWPVCGVSEMSAPRRMGAALTYARRYALFTLVGIAGEDDLDAPDLGDAPKNDVAKPDAERPPDPNAWRSSSEYAPGAAAQAKPTNAGRRAPLVRPARPILAPDQSALQRDRLAAELERLQSADDAAAWAHLSLPAKNTLTTDDAQLVEAKFRAKLAGLGEGRSGDGQGDEAQSPPGAQLAVDNGLGKGVQDDAAPHEGPSTADKAFASQSSIGLPAAGRPRLVAKTIRLRDKDHRKFVAEQPCLLCGRTPADPHHLRFAQPRALGRKVSDEFTVPVCRLHHNELHRHGDEAAWWAGVHVDTLPIALALWRGSQVDGARIPAHGSSKRQAAAASTHIAGEDQTGV